MLCGHATVAAAQTPMVPYFGKNNPHYDTFEWHIYTTDHFEIYYYPALKPHLERIAGYAESAYQQISADLKHDLSFKVQLILFKTHSEFEQENIDPGAAQEGVGAFAEPGQKRIVAPIDDPPDRLYGLIVHELTHQFEFDIIPQGLIRRSVPLWVNEGLSDYERGQWEPLDLMAVRDAAIADIIPKMTELEGYGGGGGPSRLIYNLGHAVFEYIEAKFGKEGIRQFLFSLRKSVIGGGEDAYEEALRMKKDEFDQNFEKYLKDRFKPFRDKERPADYGRDLSPNKEKTKFAEALSIAPSPSGDLIAVVTVNRKDQELDIVLVSSKDGSIVRNLTGGFDKDLGFDHLVQMGVDQVANPWMAWSPKGDRLAYFVRTEKERTLIIQNVLTRKIEERIPMKTVDEPESPAFSPDGHFVAFDGAAQRGRRHLRGQPRHQGGHQPDRAIRSAIARRAIRPTASSSSTPRASAATTSCSASISTPRRRRRSRSAPRTRPACSSSTTTRSCSARPATDPAVPLEPEVARNGNILNIWTLDLTTGELRQYTDAVGGNWSPIVLNEGKTNRIAFVSYFKNEYSIRTLERKEPLHTASTADFGGPGPIIDFQAPLQHTLVAENDRKKGRWEKMFLEGRPPVNVGVTSNGDIFGGTQVSFGDVLGDKQVNFFAASISQYRTLSLSYVNLSQRFQWALQGYSQTQFFYGQSGGYFYDPSLAPILSRDDAIATRTVRGGSAIGIYPFSRYRRVELSGGLMQLDEEYNDPDAAGAGAGLPAAALRPAGASQRHADAARRGVHPGDDDLPRVRPAGRQHDARWPTTWRRRFAGLLSRQTLDGDARYYQRLGSTGVLAMRVRGFKSFGEFPDFQYFGGNSAICAATTTCSSPGRTSFANAELRFPLIEAALTPIGVVGGVRGVFFAGIGGAWFSNSSATNPCTGEARGFKFATSSVGDLPGADRLQDRRARQHRPARPTRRPAS